MLDFWGVHPRKLTAFAPENTKTSIAKPPIFRYSMVFFGGVYRIALNLFERIHSLIPRAGFSDFVFANF